MVSELNTLDVAILGLYLCLVFVFGLIFSKRSGKSLEDYFLAGRNATWFVIGSSLFITTVSSEHIIGYAENGYLVGIANGNYAWLACFVLIMMSWVFIPVYIKSKVYTMPEYIERRFGKGSRLYISIFSIFSYVVTKVSVTLFAGALLLEELIGWDKYTSSVVLVLITGAFAIAGGFKTVLYTGVFHMIVLVLGGTILTVYGLYDIGGIEGFASVDSSQFELFKPIDDPDIPWTGMIFGAPILGIWYWCTDQYMVQRVLAAKNIHHARRGSLFAGFLMILVVFILLIPGIIAKVKYPDLDAEAAHDAYFLLVNNVLPVGLRGFVVAGLLSALMSSLMASFNSGSTLFTLDIYKKMHPDASEFKIVNVGKVATLTIVILGLIWVPFINAFEGGLINYLQLLQSFFAPPIAAIFLVGILWPRATAGSARAVIIFGFLVFVARFIIEIMIKLDLDFVGPNSLLRDIAGFNFLYMAGLLFIFYVLLMIVISLSSVAPDEDHTRNLTISRLEGFVRSAKDLAARRTNIIVSITLAGTMIAIWILFSV